MASRNLSGGVDSKGDYKEGIIIPIIHDLPKQVPIFVSEWLGMHISLFSKLLEAARAEAITGINQVRAIEPPTVYLFTI